MKQKISFQTKDKCGNIKTVVVNSIPELIKVVSDIKLFGGKVFLSSLNISDTIQIGNTYIIKNCKRKVK